VGVPVVIGPSAPAPVVIGPSAPAPAPVVIGPSAPAPVVTGPSPVVTPPAMIGPSPGPAADPVLARREVDAALADFGALAVGFQAAFTPAGVKVESVLAGSLFAKAGLRAGDVIESVDGRPLRSLDDVAALYARAQALRVVTAQVVRGGKPVALRVTIQ
jgi:membrane-associated protease RseP (regulator of RpoE activity)